MAHPRHNFPTAFLPSMLPRSVRNEATACSAAADTADGCQPDMPEIREGRDSAPPNPTETVAALRAELDSALDAADFYRKDRDGASRRAAEIALERDSLKVANTRLQARVSELEHANANLDSTVESLHQQLLLDQVRTAGEIGHYMAEAAAARCQIERLPRDMVGAHRSITAVERHLAAALAKVAQLEADRVALNAELATIGEKLSLCTSTGIADDVALEQLTAVARVGLDQRISTMSYFSAGRALANPCLRSGTAMAKFQQGLARASGEGLAACVAGGNFVVAFHGTPCVEDILCRGFDTKLRNRNGQIHGAGEYFARDSNTAEQYAARGVAIGRGTPGVVVTLIIKSKARRVNDGMWFVVDNPADDATSSYCLPLMAVPVQGVSTLMPCPRCAHAAGESRTVEFEDDSGTWTAMAADVASAVLAAYDRQQTVCVVTVRGNVYDFDWQRMEQINTTTRTRRRIRFVGGTRASWFPWLLVVVRLLILVACVSVLIL